MTMTKFKTKPRRGSRSGAKFDDETHLLQDFHWSFCREAPILQQANIHTNELRASGEERKRDRSLLDAKILVVRGAVEERSGVLAHMVSRCVYFHSRIAKKMARV